MKAHFGFTLVAAGVMVAGCNNKDSAPPPPTATNATANAQAKTNSGQEGNPITAPVDYVGAVVKAQQLAVKTIDVASLKNAIDLFNAQEDRYPKDLNELVEKHYIGAVPAAPNGMQLQYDAKQGSIKVVKK